MTEIWISKNCGKSLLTQEKIGSSVCSLDGNLTKMGRFLMTFN